MDRKTLPLDKNTTLFTYKPLIYPNIQSTLTLSTSIPTTFLTNSLNSPTHPNLYSHLIPPPITHPHPHPVSNNHPFHPSQIPITYSSFHTSTLLSLPYISFNFTSLTHYQQSLFFFKTSPNLSYHLYPISHKLLILHPNFYTLPQPFTSP